MSKGTTVCGHAFKMRPISMLNVFTSHISCLDAEVENIYILIYIGLVFTQEGVIEGEGARDLMVYARK